MANHRVEVDNEAGAGIILALNVIFWVCCVALVGTFGFVLTSSFLAAMGLLTLSPIVFGVLISAGLAMLTAILAMSFYDILKNTSQFPLFKKVIFGMAATFYTALSGLLLYKFTHISTMAVSAGFAHVMAGIGFGALAVGLPIIFIAPLVVIGLSLVYKKLMALRQEAAEYHQQAALEQEGVVGQPAVVGQPVVAVQPAVVAQPEVVAQPVVADHLDEVAGAEVVASDEAARPKSPAPV